MKSIFDNLRSLRNCDDDYLKNEISKEIFKEIVENESFSRSVFENALRPMVKKSLPIFYLDNMSTFLEFDVKIYLDIDNLKKISIFLAIIQDHEFIENNFDEKLLSNLVKTIKTAKLENIVNDINVNHLQYRTEPKY